jgi:biopolymer transport protein ExbB/TolQ
MQSTISVVDLFMQAGPVGKAVITGLLAVSLWCWSLILLIALSVRRLKKGISQAAAGRPSPVATALYDTGVAARRIAIPGESVGETRARLQEAMNRSARAIIGRVEGGLPNLAVISSVAPFVGLFGTVWGIMTSFISIADAKDTSLAVVAPGIAEALAATAIGLVAAIPASVGYSRLGAALSAAAGELTNLIEQYSVLLMTHSERDAGE